MDRTHDAVFVIPEEDSSVGRMARLNLQNAQRLMDWERQTPEYERKIKSFEDRYGYLGPFPLEHSVYSSGPNKRVKSSDAPDESMSTVTSSGTPQAHEANAMVTSSAVAEREATLHEKTINEDPNQKLKEMAISDLNKHGFTGSEIVDAAIIFAKAPEQMQMMMALPELLRRDYVQKMLKNEAGR